MSFVRILVAYDGSAPSSKALDHAIHMAKSNSEVELRVVHIFQLSQYFLGNAFVTASPQVNGEIYEYAMQLEGQVKEKVSFLGDRATVESQQGPPGQALVKYAEDNGCDMVIIGSRGLSGLKKFVLGSVSLHVVQFSKLPVLVMK